MPESMKSIILGALRSAILLLSSQICLVSGDLVFYDECGFDMPEMIEVPPCTNDMPHGLKVLGSSCVYMRILIVFFEVCCLMIICAYIVMNSCELVHIYVNT